MLEIQKGAGGGIRKCHHTYIYPSLLNFLAFHETNLFGILGVFSGGYIFSDMEEDRRVVEV